MFKFLKRMLGRDDVAAVDAAPAAVSAAPMPAPRVVEKAVGGGVEVASLPLRAILEKLPPELRAIVNQLPDPSVKIVLPVNTILKQLATGAVKMSLASLLRQAPQGTFKTTVGEEKQMVEVPLAEVFKCVDAARLGRRTDQRRYDVPEDVAGLFGRNGSTRSVTAAASAPAEAPRAEVTQPISPALAPVPGPVARVEPAKIVRMPGIAPAAPTPTNGNGNGHAAAPTNGNGKGNGHTTSAVPASVPKPHAPVAAPKPHAVPAAVCTGDLVLSFVELASSWPEGIRSELSLVPGDTKLVIPAPAVSGGLQKGRVVFPWSQVRMWLKPGLSAATAIPEDFELVFPLKIVAPAFVVATGATKRREAAQIDHSLPDFFGPSAGQQPKSEAPAPAPAAETVQPIVAPPAEIVAEIAPPAPEPVAAPLKFTLVREEPTAVPEVAPVSEPVAQPVAVPHAASASSPTEIVRLACELPGVAGAVVALEEGLVVAQKLPSGFSADTFAAFMPQIFGRLEKYTSEMQLGAAAEITIQSAQGPWSIARRGKIYFGILGRAGERLPDSLGNLADQLAAHNS